MNILEQIMIDKRVEVEERKSLYPVKLLEQSIFFPTQPLSMRKYLLRKDKTGIIAEFKRKSPSKGIINAHASVESTSRGYMQAGASALSILTDKKHFNGTSDDLVTARKLNYCPILRKDFILDEYQVVEAKSIGADTILLIAAALAPERVKTLVAFAHSFGLEVLLEVHDEQELIANTAAGADLIGVNNRNLKTFEVNVETSKRLAPIMSDGVVTVSESGISSVNTIRELKTYGYSGFLIGETFMKHARPEVAAKEFMGDLRKQTTSLI